MKGGVVESKYSNSEIAVGFQLDDISRSNAYIYAVS
jgi:hypothetical protein